MQAILAVTVVRSQSAAVAETTALRLLTQFLAVNTVFAPAVVGVVKNHTHVQQQWDVEVM